MRFALGMGGLAISLTITRFIAVSAVGIAAPAQPAPAGATALTSVTRPVNYVALLPGQTAPPGATVIDATAPKPVIVVTQATAPPRSTVTIRTTQSGTVLP